MGDSGKKNHKSSFTIMIFAKIMMMIIIFMLIITIILSITESPRDPCVRI